MSLSDPLGDMLTRIRNGQLRRKESVLMPASRFRGNVLDVLHREGYIICAGEDLRGVCEPLGETPRANCSSRRSIPPRPQPRWIFTITQFGLSLCLRYLQ